MDRGTRRRGGAGDEQHVVLERRRFRRYLSFATRAAVGSYALEARRTLRAVGTPTVRCSRVRKDDYFIAIYMHVRACVLGSEHSCERCAHGCTHEAGSVQESKDVFVHMLNVLLRSCTTVGWATSRQRAAAQEAQMHTITVPTADTVRQAFLLQTLIACEYHVLFSGLTGTGKTVVIQQEPTHSACSSRVALGGMEMGRVGQTGRAGQSHCTAGGHPFAAMGH